MKTLTGFIAGFTFGFVLELFVLAYGLLKTQIHKNRQMKTTINRDRQAQIVSSGLCGQNRQAGETGSWLGR